MKNKEIKLGILLSLVLVFLPYHISISRGQTPASGLIVNVGSIDTTVTTGYQAPDNSILPGKIDANQFQKMALAYPLPGECTTCGSEGRLFTEDHYIPVIISTATTTIVSNTPSFLHAISIQGGEAGTFKCYNNSSTATGDLLFNQDYPSNGGPTILIDAVASVGIVCVTSADTNVVVTKR